jgi:translation initiation factor 2 alpha subunit (eIF-2alpha)
MKGPPMGRTPNYRFDRMQRDKAKAEKKAEKAAAKAKKAAEQAPEEAPIDTPPAEEE